MPPLVPGRPTASIYWLGQTGHDWSRPTPCTRRISSIWGIPGARIPGTGAGNGHRQTPNPHLVQGAAFFRSGAQYREDVIKRLTMVWINRNSADAMKRCPTWGTQDATRNREFSSRQAWSPCAGRGLPPLWAGRPVAQRTGCQLHGTPFRSCGRLFPLPFSACRQNSIYRTS